MKALLFDGSNIMWRSFFSRAAFDMSRKDGLITGGVVAFIKTLVAASELHHPTHGAVIFDGPGPSFRALVSNKYKASRDHLMQEGAVEQIPYMRRAVECLGFTLLDSAPYEADDVIASLSKKYDGVIISDDKDLGCLVRKGVVQHRPCDAKGDKHPLLDEAAIKQRWSVSPNLISDVLALSGDVIDEVAGLKGVGLVTAKQLLAKYGSVEQFAIKAANGEGSKWMQRAGAMSAIVTMTAMTRLVDAPVPELNPRLTNWPQLTIDLLLELEAHATAKALARRHGVTLRANSRQSKGSGQLFSSRRNSP